MVQVNWLNKVENIIKKFVSQKNVLESYPDTSLLVSLSPAPMPQWPNNIPWVSLPVALTTFSGFLIGLMSDKKTALKPLGLLALMFVTSLSFLQMCCNNKTKHNLLTRVQFHRIQAWGYHAKSWKIWPMGCQIAVMSHLLWHSIDKIFQDFASYHETLILWNQTLFSQLLLPSPIWPHTIPNSC